MYGVLIYGLTTPITGGTTMTDPVSRLCDFGCGRPIDIEDGWGFAACNGHMIVGRANKDSHGQGAITNDEYAQRIEKAREWFKANPRPGELL